MATYRVIGGMGMREKVIAEGLSREDALAMAERVRQDPLCRGYWVSVEQENAAVDSAISAMAGVHGAKAAHRVGEGVTEEPAAPAPAPEAACDQCHAPHSTDDLHADGFTGRFVCKACHPAYRREAQQAAKPARKPRKPRRPWDATDQEQRNFRAQQQAADYAIRPHDGSLILEKANGDCYLVNADSCTCMDWLHRVSKCAAGTAACKHQVLASQWLLAAGLTWTGETFRQPAPLYPAGPADLARPERVAA